MIKQQARKKRNLKLSDSLPFILLFLLITTAAGASDLLENASLLEREGRGDEARKLYLQWLSLPESSNSERFGRILIHTLRMPAGLDEDLDLIEKHLKRVASPRDRQDITRTAFILSELSGNYELSSMYLKQLRAMDRDSQDIILNRTTLEGKAKYEYISALRDKAGSSDLLLWIDNVHRESPELITEPDWLFQLYTVLRAEGYDSQAGLFRKMILDDYPDSVEASLLLGKAAPLTGPEGLFTGNYEGDFAESSSPAPSGQTSPSYYQAGAFQGLRNAEDRKKELESSGLIAEIRKEGNIYKVIIISRSDSQTEAILKREGISAFRIRQ
ncbi:MAG: SPOR domain-containing protein [Spirochaetales bacterium]|nr:SPOR domain-containing protein [Spirochaetales bacterium]